MVKGLDTFKRHFAEYADCYILIGGSACDVNFSVAALRLPLDEGGVKDEIRRLFDV